MVPILLLVVLTAPLGAQTVDSGFTIGLRASGVAGTPLIADDIGQSLRPDTLLDDRFLRDSVMVRMGIAPALTAFVGLSLGADTELEIAAGYTLGQLSVSQGSATRDGGDLAIGHAVVAVRKPVRGFLARIGAGALWMHGSEMTVMRDMRRLNPLLEIAATRRWDFGGYDLEAGLSGQAAQLSSEAVEVRQGPAGMIYRLGLELGIARRFGR